MSSEVELVKRSELRWSSCG